MKNRGFTLIDLLIIIFSAFFIGLIIYRCVLSIESGEVETKNSVIIKQVDFGIKKIVDCEHNIVCYANFSEGISCVPFMQTGLKYTDFCPEFNLQGD